jgi:hypothetical protein
VRRNVIVASLLCCLLTAACSLVENVDDYAGGGGGDAKVDSGEPDTAQPDTLQPDTAQPDTLAPDTLAPDTTQPDSAPDVTKDASDASDASDTSPDVVDAAETPTVVRHTIAIDGTNDFVAATEKLPTTTTAFDAYVTWDASAIYVGYVGADLGATASNTKWLFIYLDRDPGAATGATKTAQYASQQHTLPNGFGAETYYAIKADGSFSQLKIWSGTSWDIAATNPVTQARNATSNYVEVKLPLSVLGGTAPSMVGVVTFLLNETSGGEWTWAGLWNGSFVDGTSLATSPLKISAYLQADWSSTVAPNSTSNKKP